LKRFVHDKLLYKYIYISIYDPYFDYMRSWRYGVNQNVKKTNYKKWTHKY